jgi:hypothetical protein
VAVLLLAIGALLHLLYNFGVGPASVTNAEGVTTQGAGFNFFFFLQTLYLWSFILIHALVVVKPDHPKSLEARTYFNFLNNIVGRGLFLIFMSLVLLSKTDQGEWFFAIVVICTGIVNIILGWNEAK